MFDTNLEHKTYKIWQKSYKANILVHFGSFIVIG
jgi:hypothetical protein